MLDFSQPRTLKLKRKLNKLLTDFNFKSLMSFTTNLWAVQLETALQLIGNQLALSVQSTPFFYLAHQLTAECFKFTNFFIL